MLKTYFSVFPAKLGKAACFTNGRSHRIALFLSLWSFLCTIPVFSNGQSFLAVDKHALATPAEKAISISSLAEYLCAAQPDETHKARAIYAWVTTHITYVDSTDEQELWATPEYLERQRPLRVLQNRSAVCQGFANLSCALMKAVGISCEVVSGIVKDADNKIARVGHAWVAAFIDGEWRLMDPTWAIPAENSSLKMVVGAYFMPDPKEFVTRHLPDDPVWQLLDNPISEQQFRMWGSTEILAFLNNEKTGSFQFRDTLKQWSSADSNARVLQSESRTIRFNGSNDRVVFGLGQKYWGLFFDLATLLDSLTAEAILTDTIQIDTLLFESRVVLMLQFHERSRALFGRLITKERIEQAEKFYSAKDVVGLAEKIRGDMRAGVFEYLNHRFSDTRPSAETLTNLDYHFNLARQSYRQAEDALDCKKMGNHCFGIWHNRSLMALQLGRNHILYAQQLTNGGPGAAEKKSIDAHLKVACSLLTDVLDDCMDMLRKPPKFAFVEERITTARQWLVNAGTCQIRAENAALNPVLEEIFHAPKAPPRKAESLSTKMAMLSNDLQRLKDSLQILYQLLGSDFTQTARYNLEIENFPLQFNHSNLLYRIALRDYSNAIEKNRFTEQRLHIRKTAKRALDILQEASYALDFLESTQRMPADSIHRKRLQVSKLSKALNDFMNDL